MVKFVIDSLPNKHRGRVNGTYGFGCCPPSKHSRRKFLEASVGWKREGGG